MEFALCSCFSLPIITVILLTDCQPLEGIKHSYGTTTTSTTKKTSSSGGSTTPTYKVCVSAASAFKCNGKNYEGSVKLMEKDTISDDHMGEAKANAEGKFDVCGTAKGDGSPSKNEEYEPYIKIEHNCCKDKKGKEIKNFVWKSDTKSLKSAEAAGKPKTIDGVDLSAADQCKK